MCFISVHFDQADEICSASGGFFRGVAEPVAEVAEFADVLDSEAVQRDDGLLGESFLISMENHRFSLILSDF